MRRLNINRIAKALAAVKILFFIDEIKVKNHAIKKCLYILIIGNRFGDGDIDIKYYSISFDPEIHL